MTDLENPTAPVTSFRATARLLGVLSTGAGLALAVLTAYALAAIARDNIAAGLLTLAIALSARWVATTSIDEWGDYAARVIADQWRRQLLSHFRQPQREGARSRGDLALAVDRAADEPSIELLKTSAQASLLGVAVVYWAAGWLSTLLIVTLLALAIPFYQRAGKRSAALELEYHQRRALLESRQLELLTHSPELRALGAVTYGANEIAAISDSEHSIALRAIRVALESSLVTEFLSGVSIGLVAMVVGFALLGGRLTLSHGLVAVLVTSELFGYVRRYGTQFHRREDVAASVALLTRPSPVVTLPTLNDLITAHQLITDANATALTLHVRPKSRTLVSGPSGSGKTSLFHTLLGWRSPRSGTVERSSVTIGYVSVESELFSGSLWENLTLGADVTDARVRHQLDDLGLTGERFADLTVSLLADGHGLSSGERVRLVLARCLLANPALLFIDDIAGVIDVPTRAIVARALDSHADLAIVEATVDSPILAHPLVLVELER